MNLFLASSSRVHGAGWLDYLIADFDRFLGPGIRRALFIPFALHDRHEYWSKGREKFAEIGVALDCLVEGEQGREALDRAQAVVVGGGNTFRLLGALSSAGFLDRLKRRVEDGAPYIGWSAGANLACPTIMTTNDMPIVELRSFRSLGLIPWQINPHYVDPDPASTHMGETREQRIREYLEENDVPVLGLREGAWLWGDGSSLVLGGLAGAKLFRRDQEARELRPPDLITAESAPR